MKRRLFSILIVCVVVVPLFAQGRQTIGMNNPYYDDKRVHLGFALGVNLMGYAVTESLVPQDGEIFHARVSNLLPGFSVGFITDVRLAKYLNLRITPTL